MSQSQKVLVAGTGLSGISAAKLLLDMGGEVVLYDSNPELDAEELKHKFDEDARITIVLGELKRTDLLGVEMCVISPGIPLEAPFVAVLDEAKIPIWSEIQLAYQCAKGRLAAITGTNGKTTTTALTGEIMKAYYESVFVVGNIGIPYTQVAMETEDDSVTVAEVSSFQLETIMDFRPDVSAILNITPDHLNRHHTMECYIAVKESITSNQTEEDTCVLNYDDKVLREFGQSEELKPKVIFFSSRQKLDDGYYLDGDMIYYAKNKKAEAVLDVRELFHGGKVPLVKNAANWQLSLENLPYLLENLDSQRKDAENGMSYEDYLQVLLLAQSKQEKLQRGMDMIEVCIRESKGRDSFRLDCCIEAIEASVDVDANRNRVFTVTRQYSYI